MQIGFTFGVRALLKFSEGFAYLSGRCDAVCAKLLKCSAATAANLQPMADLPSTDQATVRKVLNS